MTIFSLKKIRLIQCCVTKIVGKFAPPSTLYGC